MGHRRILIIDDEENVRYMLQLTLENEGYEAQGAEDGHEGIRLFEDDPFDVVICDVKMPGFSGLDVLRAIMQLAPQTPVIMMSAYGTIEAAIEAMKQGAYDYVMKPFKQDEMLLTLRKAEERERLRRENQRLRQQVEKQYQFANIIGKSPKMQEIFRKIEKIRDYKTTVLIQGESGTGKELVAHAIHYTGNRKDFPFMPVNCGAIPHDLMESELFGHARGAFTGAVQQKSGMIAEADQGTLFLDEIGELPIALQVKLLRFLQEGEIRGVGQNRSISVDVRVIAATSRKLDEAVDQGDFRQDLYYRLHVVPLHLPPLRERPDDIPALAEHFVRKHARALGKPVPAILPETMKILMEAEWKGNVRELENALERTLVMTDSSGLTPDCLPPELMRQESDLVVNIPPHRVAMKPVMRELTVLAEQELIQRALAQTDNNRTQAAKLLEISHRALMYKIKEYQIP